MSQEKCNCVTQLGILGRGLGLAHSGVSVAFGRIRRALIKYANRYQLLHETSRDIYKLEI
jgi:hypothetical protein